MPGAGACPRHDQSSVLTSGWVCTLARGVVALVGRDWRDLVPGLEAAVPRGLDQGAGIPFPPRLLSLALCPSAPLWREAAGLGAIRMGRVYIVFCVPGNS